MEPLTIDREPTAKERREYEDALKFAECPPVDELGGKGTRVLLASLIVGPSEARVKRLTGLSRSAVREIAQRLRAAELWTREGIDAELWFESDGGIAFNLDVLVAEGMVERTQA